MLENTSVAYTSCIVAWKCLQTRKNVNCIKLLWFVKLLFILVYLNISSWYSELYYRIIINNEIENVFLKNWDWPYYKWNRMNILW